LGGLAQERGIMIRDQKSILDRTYLIAALIGGVATLITAVITFFAPNGFSQLRLSHQQLIYLTLHTLLIQLKP
jgi:hypothetical protein